MEKVRDILAECASDKLVHMVLSGARKKEGPAKVRIRPIQQRGRLAFQASRQEGKQEFHTNYEKQELLDVVMDWMRMDFKQLQILTTGENITVLSEKGEHDSKTEKAGAGG